MQPVLHFVVNNQIIARTDTFVPVRNSRNYLYAEFEFQTEDWAGKSKTALFHGGDGETVPILLGDTDTCLIPAEVLTGTSFSVSIIAGNLITANIVTVKLYESESWAHGHADYSDRQKDNAAYYASEAKNAVEEVPGRVKEGKKQIDDYVREKESQLKGETGNVYFAAFKVVGSRLIMYSDPTVDKVRFRREGSRLKYRLAL